MPCMEVTGIFREDRSLAWVFGWNGSRVSSKDKLDVSSAKSSGSPDRSRAGAASVIFRWGAALVMSRFGTAAVMFREETAPVMFRLGAVPVMLKLGAAPVKLKLGAAPVMFRFGAAPVILRFGAAPVRFKVGAAPVMLSPVLRAPGVSNPCTAVELNPVLSLVPGSTKLACKEVS